MDDIRTILRKTTARIDVPVDLQKTTLPESLPSEKPKNKHVPLPVQVDFEDRGRSLPDACPACNGAQHVLRADPSGNIMTAKGMGRLVPCPACNGDDKRQARLERVCRLTGGELDARFDGYWTKKHGPKALKAAREIMEQRGWLTLAGPYGIGKTYLLQAATNEARLSGLMAVYVTISDLLDRLRISFKPGAEVDFDEMFDAVRNCRVLCLDEIEKYNAKEWAEEKFFQLMDHRYRTWRETVTILATNNLEDCPAYLKSRMLDGRFKIVLMDASADVRPGLRRDVDG